MQYLQSSHPANINIIRILYHNYAKIYALSNKLYELELFPSPYKIFDINQ